MSFAEALVSRLAVRDPLVARLAEHASLAARLEPGLVRRLRLELVPQADASAEAELWASHLVQSRSSRELTFVARVAECLRARLAKDQRALEKTHALLELAHRGAPRLVQLEEELVFAGLLEKPDRDRISKLLREVIASMREGPNRAKGLSSWLMTNFAAWPPAVRDCEEARALALVAGTRVPRLVEVDPGFPSQRGFNLVSSLLPAGERRLVAVRRTKRYLQFHFGTAASDWHQLAVPTAAPRLEIVGHGSVTITDGTQRVHVGDEHTIRIRTPDGESFELTPRVDDWSVLRRATVTVSRRTRGRGTDESPGELSLRPAGTGFLCRPDLVLTAAHVVERTAPHDLCLIFSDSYEQRTVRAITRSERADVAVLTLSSPISGRVPLDGFTEAELHLSWRGAFQTDRELVSLDGTVTATNVTAVGSNVELIELATTGLAREPAGLSGAPVVANGRVIGMLVMRMATSSGASSSHDRLFALPAAHFPPVIEQAAQGDDAAAKRLLNAARSGSADVHELLSKLAPSLAPDSLLNAAERAIGEGLFAECLVLLEAAPDSVRCAQLRGLALSKLKRHGEALPILQRLVDQGYADVETLSLLAASYKRLWLNEKDPRQLDKALGGYRRAYELTGDSYPGINFAALALYKGDRLLSRRVAHELTTVLSKQTEIATDAWQAATLGEALLLTGNLARARQAYAAAVSLAAGRWQDVAVMRRQARIDLGYLELDRALLDDTFPVPNALAFAGYPADPPGMTTAVFPSSRLESLRKRLRSLLAERNVEYGYSSAARGADLIFIDEMIRRGSSVTVFLPEADEAFRKSWVGFGWEGMFEQIIADPKVSVRRLEPNPTAPSSSDYIACQEASLKASADIAEQLDQTASLVLLIPFDEYPLLETARKLPNTELIAISTNEL